jgi:hypothetical protein
LPVLVSVVLLACRPGPSVEEVMPSDRAVPPQPGELRFVDTRYSAFFAVTPERALIQPPDSCSSWGVSGSRWWALDAWGTVVGEHELRAVDDFVCHSLWFSPIAGERGTGLMVTGSYRRDDPARWQPDVDQLARLEARVKAIDEALARPNELPALPLAERVLAYRRTDPESAPFRTRADHSREWVMVGGRWLGLFSLEGGEWHLQQFDTRIGIGGWRAKYAYMPVAAIDLDQDGDPELIVHEFDGRLHRDVLWWPGVGVYERGIESPALR